MTPDQFIEWAFAIAMGSGIVVAALGTAYHIFWKDGV